MKNIKFNTQICTTKEQSKRLLELGLDADTSDMCWLAKKLWGDDVEIPEEDRSYILSTDKDDSFCSRYDVDCVPAWSLHRLIAMLPDEIEWLSVMLSRTCYFHPVFYKDKIAYTDMEGWRHIFNDNDNIYDNIIDCIEWLIKENKFNKEYLKKE